ncbi:TlpA family protein disulfide reductase [bacterium]|nr:TlpA family protein disulfide reductase [bacterium]
MNKYTRKSGFSWFYLLLVFCVIAISPHAVFGELNVGDIADNFTAIDMSGNEVNLYDYDGYVIMLNFFAFWCPPCQTESPLIQKEIWEFYQSQNGNMNGVPVIVIGLSDVNNPLEDYEAQVADTKDFIEKYGVTYPVLLDHGIKDEDIIRLKYNSGTVPHTVVINGVFGDPMFNQWELVYEHTGFPTSSDDEAMKAIGETKKSIDMVSPPLLDLSLWLPTDQAYFRSGDSFSLLLDVTNPLMPVDADIYFALLNHNENRVYFANDWALNPLPAIESITFPTVSYSGLELLNVLLPSIMPPIREPGLYTFVIAATKPGSTHFISNLGRWTVDVRE